MRETKKRNVQLPVFKAKVGREAVRGVMTINEISPPTDPSQSGLTFKPQRIRRA